jgi:nucleoid-associated protein YgaU
MASNRGESDVLSIPPVSPARLTQPESTARVHRVQKGETLISLSRHYYGEAGRWRAIHEANKSLVPDPNRLFPGQELVIPQ